MPVGIRGEIEALEDGVANEVAGDDGDVDARVCEDEEERHLFKPGGHGGEQMHPEAAAADIAEPELLKLSPLRDTLIAPADDLELGSTGLSGKLNRSAETISLNSASASSLSILSMSFAPSSFSSSSSGSPQSLCGSFTSLSDAAFVRDVKLGGIHLNLNCGPGRWPGLPPSCVPLPFPNSPMEEAASCDTPSTPEPCKSIKLGPSPPLTPSDGEKPCECAGMIMGGVNPTT